MANLGATFEFKAESAKLSNEIDKVRKELAALKATTKGIKDGFKLVGTAIAGAFSVRAITSWLSKVNQAGDQLDAMAQRLESSASGLQTLNIAATLAGGSTEAMQNSLAKLTTSIGDALGGSKQAVAAMGTLDRATEKLGDIRAELEKVTP
jgi:uncharacterized protein YukE